MGDRRATGALEREVMTELWRTPHGATPGEVRDALVDDLAYTTVMTILARLWKKGLVERHLRGRAYVYQPLSSEAELVARRMQEVLAPASDRRLVLSQFVDGLSRRDERALRKILGELDR